MLKLLKSFYCDCENNILILMVCSFIGKCLSMENYIILPQSLKYCKEKSSIRDFTITKQISLDFNGLESLNELNETNSIKFVCHVLVKPLGKRLFRKYDDGSVSFWKLRIKLNIKLTCLSMLTLHFLEDDKTYDNTNLIPPEDNAEKAVFRNFSCETVVPITVNAMNRKLSIWWSTDDVYSLDKHMIDIQISTYMSFYGNFSLSQKESNCIQLYGFWCRSVNICINAQLRCDGADGCFDGGSDELECPPVRNTTRGSNKLQAKDHWSNYLPWIAVTVLLLVLFFILSMVCSQRKRDFDSTHSDNDSNARNSNDMGIASCKRESRQENSSSEFSDTTEGFCIRYGGRIHRLSGVPQENDSSDSNDWNQTNPYLPTDHLGTDNATDRITEVHTNFVDFDENSPNPVKDTKPKLHYKSIDYQGGTSPTLTTNGSSIGNSPIRIRSQMSVLTFCESDNRSTGIVRSPSAEEEIMMKEFVMNDDTKFDSSRSLPQNDISIALSDVTYC